jgi:hypothetical protein
MTVEELKRLIDAGKLNNTQVSALVDSAQGELWDNTAFEDINNSSFMDQYDSYDALRGTGVDNAATAGGLKGLFGDKYMMGNITGLASTLMQAAALPSMLEQAKLQNKSLKFNLNTAKQEQARRNNNISAFNSFRG